MDDAKSGTGGGERSLIQKVDDLRDHLQTIEKTLHESNTLQNGAKGDISSANNSLSEADRIIQEASKELKIAIDLLQTEGVSELMRANNKSKQFDHQSEQMSEISRTARGLAEDLENTAKDSKDSAKQAKEMALNASDMARKSIDMQRSISEELRAAVAPELQQTSKKLDGLGRLTTEALEKANRVYDESLTLFSNINSITPPEINVTPIKQEANKLMESAKAVNVELDDILNNNG